MTEPTALLHSSLGTLGVSVSRIVSLSRLGSAAAYRVDRPNGEPYKARVFSREADAAWVECLLRLPSAVALPRPVGRVDRTLVVEFVRGDILERVLRDADGDEEVRFAEATGRLLAGLHRGGRRYRNRASTPEQYRSRMSRTVEMLASRRLIEAEDARRLVGLSAPARARAGLTHGDVCPENLIVMADGELRIVDEERLNIRPVAFDLARVVQRWPLTPRGELAFLTGYANGGGYAGAFVSRRAFWLATALAVSAEYRLAHHPETLDRTIDHLQALARDAR